MIGLHRPATRDQARARRRDIGETFLGIWGLNVLLKVILDDIGLEPDGWAWDAFELVLSVAWVLALLALLWAFIAVYRARPDAEEEFANFLEAFAGWEAKLAQQDRQLSHAELRLGENDRNPEVVAYVADRSVAAERVLRWPMEHDGGLERGKKVSQQLGIHLTELTAEQWEQLEPSTRVSTSADQSGTTPGVA